MASPGVESFCCLLNFSYLYGKGYVNFSGEENQTTSILEDKMYNGVCIFSSSLSIVGALFLLIPCKKFSGYSQHSHEISTKISSTSNGYLKGIIYWLIVSDLIACSGLLIRASVWISAYDPLSQSLDDYKNPVIDFTHVFCILSSSTIQYFYISTYMWTLCYAIEVTRLLQGKQSKKWLYHVIGWVASGVICIAGLVPLYYPSIFSCSRSLANTIPHLLSTYMTLICVMIVNPILYTLSFRSVKSLMSIRFGRYTNRERMAAVKLRDKFLLITVVFYICWIPNIVNVFLLGFRHQVNSSVFSGLWIAMAALNPLQAVLNILVYGNFRKIIHLFTLCKNFCTKRNQYDEIRDRTSDGYSISYNTNSTAASSHVLQYR